MAAVEVAGLALAATGLCFDLASDLYFLIREIKDASKDARKLPRDVGDGIRLMLAI
jgi:hypothetical protein